MMVSERTGSGTVERSTKALSEHKDLPGRFCPQSEQRVPPRSDEPAIFRYLDSFDSFGAAASEGFHYIRHAFRRFLLTIDLLPAPSQAGARLLEIGAHPYYITLLAHGLHGYDLYLTNFFGNDYPPRGCQTIESASFHERVECNFSNINIECTSLPYDDETFDAVLLCEVIEHLTEDPTFALAEIHRVLRPGGSLLLTTPSVFRMRNVLDLIQMRHNIYHPYSGHGVYGRHQREYGVDELRDLVAGCGFTIERVVLADIEPPTSWFQSLVQRIAPSRRDNIFLLARRGPQRRLYYPRELYIAMDSVHRVTASEVIMGTNEVGHLSSGWWQLETIPGGYACWTSERASLWLLAAPGASSLQLDVLGGPAALGAIELTIAIGQQRYSRQLPTDHWTKLEIRLDAPIEAGEVQVTLVTGSARSPQELGLSGDNRKLGVMVRRVRLA